MQQDIYFPRRPSLDAITSVYDISSLLLLIGVIVFGVILMIALISLVRILIALRKVRKEQALLFHDMETFYKKQLKLMHGKHFLTSLYQYSKLLVQLRQGRDVRDIRRIFWLDEEMIQYMEKTIMGGNELDYEHEKRIKDILHQRIES